MKSLDEYSLEEIRLIYQLLHSQVLDTPALMDSELLSDLQRYLQQQATRDGVDVSAHSEWSAWLEGMFQKS